MRVDAPPRRALAAKPLPATEALYENAHGARHIRDLVVRERRKRRDIEAAQPPFIAALAGFRVDSSADVLAHVVPGAFQLFFQHVSQRVTARTERVEQSHPERRQRFVRARDLELLKHPMRKEARLQRGLQLLESAANSGELEQAIEIRAAPEEHA